MPPGAVLGPLENGAEIDISATRYCCKIIEQNYILCQNEKIQKMDKNGWSTAGGYERG
jgi:hypothetical protein